MDLLIGSLSISLTNNTQIPHVSEVCGHGAWQLPFQIKVPAAMMLHAITLSFCLTAVMQGSDLPLARSKTLNPEGPRVLALQGDAVRQVWPVHLEPVNRRSQPDRPHARPFGSPPSDGTTSLVLISHASSNEHAPAFHVPVVTAKSPPVWSGE